MKENQIIAALAYAHKNQQDIADAFGCTKQNVSTRIKRENSQMKNLKKWRKRQAQNTNAILNLKTALKYKAVFFLCSFFQKAFCF